MGKTKRKNILGQKKLTDSSGVNFKKLSEKTTFNTKKYKTVETLKYYEGRTEDIAFCHYFNDKFKVKKVKRTRRIGSPYYKPQNLREEISISLDDYRKYKGAVNPKWIERFQGDKVILDNGFHIERKHVVIDSVFEETEDYSKIPNTTKNIYFSEQKQYKNKKRLDAAEDKIKNF